LRSHVSGPDLALVQISLCLIKKGELDYAEEVLLRIMNPDFRPGLSYVKNLLLGFIRARTGNIQEAACCFLRAVDTNEGGRYNAARQHAAGVLATLGMKKEAGYLLSPKAPDKMIIMKIMKTVQEITSIGDNQVTESKNEDGTVFSLQHSPPHVANRLSVLRSRPIKKEIKNNSSSLEKKMNLCLRCEKASVCPGQLPCQSAWNRRSWYCPFGFIPTSPPTPYEG